MPGQFVPNLPSSIALLFLPSSRLLCPFLLYSIIDLPSRIIGQPQLNYAEESSFDIYRHLGAFSMPAVIDHSIKFSFLQLFHICDCLCAAPFGGRCKSGVRRHLHSAAAAAGHFCHRAYNQILCCKRRSLRAKMGLRFHGTAALTPPRA